MKRALALALALATSASAGKVPSLTPDNWESMTAGKTVFIKFFSPKCGPCLKLAPDWEKISDEFSGLEGLLIAEVDCIAHSRLCTEKLNGVKRYPTMMYGAPYDLVKYEGSREFDGLHRFVWENLRKPVCSPTNIDLCDEEKKAEFAKYRGMVGEELDKEIVFGEKKLKDAIENMEVEIARIKLKETGDDLKDAIAKVQSSYQKEMEGSKLTVMKAVKEEKVNPGRKLTASSFAGDSQAEKANPPKVGTSASAGDSQTEKVDFDVPSLNSGNYDSLAAGKSVFIKFFAPWCGHCKKMANDYKKLSQEYADHKTNFIAEIDCTDEASGGKTLCEQNGIRGFPTLKYGDPYNLDTYTGKGRDYATLKAFVEVNLKPLCSPDNIDLCDDEKKKSITKLQGLDAEGLEKEIVFEEKKLKDAEEKLKADKEKLDSDHDKYVKASSIGIMKSIKAAKARAAKPEL